MKAKKKFPKSKSKESKKYLHDYARYSNLALKLIATILVGFFGGMKLDHWLKLEFPVFTLVLAFTGLFLSLYLLIKGLLK